MVVSVKSGAFVVGGGQEVSLSSMFSVTADAKNPTYLILTGLDRNEYTSAATGVTGTLSGDGTTAVDGRFGSDCRSFDVVFTYDASTGRYYNSTYGYFDEMTYTSSSSANDITNLSLYATSDAKLANSYFQNAYSIAHADPAGYVGSVTVATQPGFGGAVPAQATPDSIAAVAQSFVGKAWNVNGCWVLASTIAAEAGASLPVDSGMMGVSGQANGEWFVAFDGSKQTGDWPSMVKTGDIVVIGNSRFGHITTCVAGSGSSAMLIDNMAYVSHGRLVNAANDGSANDLIIASAHVASQEWVGVSTSMVKIYQLDTPIVSTSVASGHLVANASQTLSQLFSAVDPLGKAVTQYQVFDSAATDSFTVNGTTEAAHSAASAITTSSLSSVCLVAGAAACTDTLQVRAFNGSYWGDWQTLGVSVGGASAPLVAAQTTDQTWAQGLKVSFTLPTGTFVDPAGQALTYTASQEDGQALPAWLSFDPTKGAFSGTVPTGMQTLHLMVTATDTSGLATSEDFSVTVPAAPPTVASHTANQTWTAGQHVSLALDSHTFGDADGLALTLSASQANGQALPSWLAFDTATGTFSGTVPTGTQAGFSLKVTATDTTGQAAAETFNVRISTPAPVVANQTADQTWAPGQQVSFTLPSNTFADPQGEHLTHSACQLSGRSLISWLHFNATTDTFSGNVPMSASGSATIDVVARNTDGVVANDIFHVTFAQGTATVGLVGSVPANGLELSMS